MEHARKAFGLAVIIVLSDIIAGRIVVSVGFEHPWWPLIISASIALTTLYIFSKYNPIRWIAPLRRFFFGEVSTYEGFWVSVVSHPDRPYSLSKVYYSHLNNRWVSRGYAFDAGHKIVASWKGDSIYFDHASKFWFFKGVWQVHEHGSPDPTGPAYDQFFKMKTNPGNTNRMSTIIIDNTDSVGSGATDSRRKTEILISEVRRVNSHSFREALNFLPKRIEEITKCDPQIVAKLIAQHFDASAQHDLRLSRSP